VSPCGRLHVIKPLNEAADKIRRQEHRQLSAAGNHTLTYTEYLWRQRRENLCQRAAAEFRSLLGQDLQTGTAWPLKENFRRLWKYTSVAWALKFLWDGVETARATELTPLVKAADMIDKHAEGILNYLMHPICLRLSRRRIRVIFFLGKLDFNPA
jgi:transposase